MNAIDRFSLEQHKGPYEKWPLRSRLFLDGSRTSVRVPGYHLLQQLKIGSGYLLVTDCDCPFDEATSFIVLDSTIRTVAVRTLFASYGSFNLDRIEWINPSRFWAVFAHEDYWLVAIRAWGIPFLRPRLLVRRSKNPKQQTGR